MLVGEENGYERMYNDQIQGIDISAWQAIIDWDKVRAIPNLRFVFVKATQGVNHVDPMFRSHRAGAIRAGKDTGCTHFLDYANYIFGTEIEFGRRQADFFHYTTQDNPGQAGYLLDTETNEGAAWPRITLFNVGRILKIALAFHNRMMELGRKFGGDYIAGWVAAYMKNFTEGFGMIPRYKLLTATRDMVFFDGSRVAAGKTYQPEITHFLSAAELSAYLKPDFGAYPKATIWQYGSRLIGTLLGCPGYVDADIFNGTEQEYSAWLGKISVPTQPAPIEDAPIPITNPAGKLAQVITSVNVRNGIGTAAAQYSLNGTPWVLLKSEPPIDVMESAHDSRGNPWLRIGFEQWICAEFNGSKLVQVS